MEQPSHTIVHLSGDETGAELGEEMRRLAQAAEKHFGLPVQWEDFDLSLVNRTVTNNAVVDAAAARVRKVGVGVKDATISLEPDDKRRGIKGSPNAKLRKGIQGKDTLGTVIVREAGPLPGLPVKVPGNGFGMFKTTVVRQGAGGFYNAVIKYSRDLGTGQIPGPPDRNDLEEIVWTNEPVTRGQHRVGAMFAFKLAHASGATVIGGPKYTIHDGDGAFQREIRRARDVFSGRPVVALTGEGILYSNETVLNYREEIAQERRNLGLGEGISERALVAYNEWLIDALYAWLIQHGPQTLCDGEGSDIVIPTTNRDGDCLSDLIAPIYSSVAGMTSEITAVNDRYEATAMIAEAAHGTAPRSYKLNRANPLAMFLALATVYKRLAEQNGRVQKEASSITENYQRAANAIHDACMRVIGDGLMTADFARRFQAESQGRVHKVLKMTEFTDEVIGRATAG